ncbi:holo-ACP synthase [Hippea maritima]|uniref:Holo-[acyl-carrier-protein] synthase n=1 Tax=Hippea maritima (strain ATCC 700847 / DSM 10411 / MH2) TaxID=760142 RepID=F2LUV1_HIPMA|nr:holo-ACP synthase [Hippea maritima]AEA33556.1 Holo-(acyl-carrier-protein) synthase [Hippea maritima DSM 10411]
MEVGIDIEEIERIEKAHKQFGDRFLRRVFSEEELNYCFSRKNPYPSLCGRFCAKEAVVKVYAGKLLISDVKIVNAESGKPMVFIRNKPSDIAVSISHSKHYATAVAVKP